MQATTPVRQRSSRTVRRPRGRQWHARSGAVLRHEDGTLAMGWGSGTTNFPYLITPLEAIQQRARQDRSSVSWWLSNWDLPGAAATALDQDVALVFVNSDSGEDYITVAGNEGDRMNLTAWGQGDNLINAVAAANTNTIVVVHSVGPLIVEPWIDNPNVTAVLWANLPGQEPGNSLVDILYGDVHPSGRLRYTIAKDTADSLAHVSVADMNTTEILKVDYTEGILIDYDAVSPCYRLFLCRYVLTLNVNSVEQH